MELKQSGNDEKQLRTNKYTSLITVEGPQNNKLLFWTIWQD